MPVATTRTGLYGQVVRRFLARSWKADEPTPGGPSREDGARRSRLEAALTELAWHMAAAEPAWRDTLPAGRCEEVLAAAGAPAAADHSRLWDAVRHVGILVQEGVGPDEPMGDGSVM